MHGSGLRRNERGRGRCGRAAAGCAQHERMPDGAEQEVGAGEGHDDDEQDKDAVKGRDEAVDIVVEVGLECGGRGVDTGFEVREGGGERGRDVADEGGSVGARRCECGE